MSQELIARLCNNWQHALLENRKILGELSQRCGLSKPSTIKALELGLAHIPSRGEMPEKIATALSSFGILDESLSGMISLPLRKKDNHISNVYFVSLNGRADKIVRKGGVVNLKAIRTYKRLVVVDNLADCFAYFEQVRENVVPLIESEVMLVDVAEAVKASTVEELILVNDSPYWPLLMEKLQSAAVAIYPVTLPEGMSIRDYLAMHSANKLTGYLEAGKAQLVKAGKESAGQREYLVMTEGVGELYFTAEDRKYLVRGFNAEGFEKIIQLTLEMEGRTFPDKVDLARSQSRARFAASAAFEFETSVESIRNDLAYIYKKLDVLQDRRFREKAGIHEKNIYVALPDDLKKAIDLASKRDLLDELLLKDTERLGYVEEETNKKLFFLAGVSRLTGKPLSVLDISPSGTGKSFGMSTVMDLMPPDEILRYSRLSQNALYYKTEEELRGKVLYIEELVGMEDSLKAIRMLLSSGELSVAGVEKDPRTGTLKGVERRITVDLPLLSSGVTDLFDEETLSRFVQTYNDLTPEHVKRILKAQAARYSLESGTATMQREKILKRHRDIQKSLDSRLVVVNPYSDQVMLNPKLHIATRKQEQYLRLMYNIAFTRQHGKEKHKELDRDGKSCHVVHVTPQDVATANEIARHIFRYAAADLTKRQADALATIEAFCKAQTRAKRMGLYEFTFSRREAREYAGWQQSTAKRLFDELEALEYLRRARGTRQGSYCTYRLVPVSQRPAGDDELRLLDPSHLRP